MVAAYNILMLCDTWAIKRWYFRKNYTLEKYITQCQEVALNGVGVATGRQSAGSNYPVKEHVTAFFRYNSFCVHISLEIYTLMVCGVWGVEIS